MSETNKKNIKLVQGEEKQASEVQSRTASKPKKREKVGVDMDALLREEERKRLLRLGIVRPPYDPRAESKPKKEEKLLDMDALREEERLRLLALGIVRQLYVGGSWIHFARIMKEMAKLDL